MTAGSVRAVLVANPSLGAGMQRVYAMTDLSIRRACGFAALGVATTMAALSFDAVLSFRTGAVLSFTTGFVLWVKAHAAAHQNVLRTEVWLLLRHHDAGISKEMARAVLPPVLRERYLWHATVAAAVALVLWLMAALFALGR